MYYVYIGVRDANCLMDGGCADPTWVDKYSGDRARPEHFLGRKFFSCGSMANDWGPHASQEAQQALAKCILDHHFKDAKSKSYLLPKSPIYYKVFQRDVIARLPTKPCFELRTDEIDRWAKERRLNRKLMLEARRKMKKKRKGSHEVLQIPQERAQPCRDVLWKVRPHWLHRKTWFALWHRMVAICDSSLRAVMGISYHRPDQSAQPRL